jgi:YidC/Oxa1 family membrane protein insertase
MDKKLLLALSLSIGTLLVFNYYTKKNQDNSNSSVPVNVRPGQSYRAPTSQDLSRPINREIDFLDKKRKGTEEIKVFNTDKSIVSFSNYGGVISDFEFKKHIGKNNYPLRTISKKSFYEREQSAFLLALDEKTPYFYDLVSSDIKDDQINVVYQSSVDSWVIKKSYTLYKETYKVDLNIKFEKSGDIVDSVRPRLFFPAPFLGGVEKEYQFGVVSKLNDKTVGAVSGRELEQDAWITPSVFGGQDKYFVHTLVSDKSNFVGRGFYKSVSDRLYVILEGPEVKKNQSYDFSFYIGPKLTDDLVAVDSRLEDLLDFGWLSWICKFLLKLLNYLYGLIGNFGLAIILMAIVIKIPFMPMTIKGTRKVKEYQKHMPALNRLKQKYKGDSQKLNLELMRFHKERGLSMMAPLSGSLPLLIQMPIFFALYRVLGNYLELYQAPFFGWITDLSAKDPYYVFPILMGIAMLIQQRVSSVQDEKTKTVMLFLPILFIGIFINFPVGLVLFWLTNNVLTIGETFLGKALYR